MKEGYDMKNYTYKWNLINNGYVEMDETEYTNKQIEMQEFIESMSVVIKNARCGWDGVRYAIMKYNNDSISEYMVLFCDGGERWIPVSGNSKGCNFSVLGENLW